VTDSSENGRAFSIERRQRLLVETDGRASETSEIFVKVYCGMATSGLLAELSGNEFKVLLALGLEAKVLGGDEEAERHFARLKAFGVVTDEDRGRLFCYLDRDTIAGRTGLSTRTVSTASSALVGRELVEKRTVRNQSGQHDYNVYLIRPSAHIGKFDFNRRPPARSEEGAMNRGKNLPTVGTVGKEPPAVGFPHVKKESSRSGGEGLDAEVFARFAERQNATSYQPTDRDVRGLAQLRTEGFSQDEILAGVDRAFATRSADSEPIQRFTYCIPVIRSSGTLSQPPQPVPTGSPAVTPLAQIPTPGDVEGTPIPVEVSPAPPDRHGDDPPSYQSPNRMPNTMPNMEEVLESVRRTEWPVGPALQTALTAKAVRVEEAAKEQGADGISWVGEAMLIALGRKLGRDGRAKPTDDELLAYVDGILGNWISKGHPRVQQRTQRVQVSSADDAQGVEEQPQEWSEGPLMAREPKSEEELLWEQALGELRLQMARATFDQWLKSSRVLEFERLEGDVARIVIGVNSPYATEWLEHRLKPVIQRTVSRLLGQAAELAFRPAN